LLPTGAVRATKPEFGRYEGTLARVFLFSLNAYCLLADASRAAREITAAIERLLGLGPQTWLAPRCCWERSCVWLGPGVIDIHDALRCRANLVDCSGSARLAVKRVARGRLEHASVDDRRACRVDGLFNINHGLTDGCLERPAFKLRALMLLHRDPDRFVQSVIASRAAARESRGLIEDHDGAVRKAGCPRGAVQLNHGTGTAA